MRGFNGKNASDGSRASVRVSLYGYFAALFILTSVSAFLVYLDYVTPGFVVLIAAWIVVPFFAFTDRIAFDGRRVFR